MKFLRVITVLSALAAVSACASMEPMGQPSASVPPTPSTPMVSAPPPSAAPVVPSAPEVTDDVDLPPSPVVVHFEHGKADITGSTMQVLWGLAPSLKAASPEVIRIQGFTDASGKASFNKILSEKRAQAVADQLRKLGITARVEVTGQGVVKGGKKGAKDQSARRVEISWERAGVALEKAEDVRISSMDRQPALDWVEMSPVSLPLASPSPAGQDAVSAPVAELTSWGMSADRPRVSTADCHCFNALGAGSHLPSVDNT